MPVADIGPGGLGAFITNSACDLKTGIGKDPPMPFLATEVSRDFVPPCPVRISPAQAAALGPAIEDRCGTLAANSLGWFGANDHCVVRSVTLSRADLAILSRAPRSGARRVWAPVGRAPSCINYDQACSGRRLGPCLDRRIRRAPAHILANLFKATLESCIGLTSTPCRQTELTDGAPAATSARPPDFSRAVHNQFVPKVTVVGSEPNMLDTRRGTGGNCIGPYWRFPHYTDP
jgi:hypothetical protein